ncbi:histidine phosphatase family protein [Cohnella panacarvi]|uniref:histidine phosphatase family protein n=1 Tax=Cohnella panacarvi TaxID=400776 RepID=UPI000478E8F6|nr:histidine phosphatase family protein [Cohnella panacarvi]
MTKAGTIGWIRHGVTEWNQLGKIQGVTDIPLSPEGIEQAKLLAERLANESMRWDGIVVSDLDRAATTGRIIAQRLGLRLLTDARLRERSFGQAEGMTLSERLERWGEDWRKHIPDQEQTDSVVKRGRQFVNELFSNHPGESWLAVSHGSFLSAMIHSMLGEVPEGYIQNVSLTVLEQQGEGWKPLIHNCTLHLQTANS